MLRRLQSINGKNIDATKTAAVAMVRGLMVQKHATNGTAIKPTSQIDLFIVNKDIQPTGLLSYEGEISDYDSRMNAIAQGDYVLLEKPMIGERFATNQYIATDFAVGEYAEVHTTADADQGKLKRKGSATEFMYVGTITDKVGDTLAIFEVLAPV